MPIWKMNFCFMFLRLSALPRWRERPQTAMCFSEWLGRLKCRVTGLEASLSFISTSLRCLRKQSPNLRPVSPMYIVLQKIGRDAREMIGDGNSSLRSGDFVRVGDERTGPTSYARTFEFAGLMIRFQCTLN